MFLARDFRSFASVFAALTARNARRERRKMREFIRDKPTGHFAREYENLCQCPEEFYAEVRI